MNHIIEQELGCVPCYNFDQNERNIWQSLAFSILQTNSKDILTPGSRTPQIKTHPINQSDSSLLISPYVSDIKSDHNQTLLSERSYAEKQTPRQDLSYKDDSRFISVDFFRLGRSKSVDRNQKLQEEFTQDMSCPQPRICGFRRQSCQGLLFGGQNIKVKRFLNQNCLISMHQKLKLIKMKALKGQRRSIKDAIRSVRSIDRRSTQSFNCLPKLVSEQRKISFLSNTKQLSFQELSLLPFNSPLRKSFLTLDPQCDTNIKSCLKISNSSHNYMVISQEPSSCQSYSGSISLVDIKEFPPAGKQRQSSNSINFVEVVVQQKKNQQNMNIYSKQGFIYFKVQSLGLKNLKKQQRLKPISLQRINPLIKNTKTCRTNNKIDSVNLDDRLEQRQKIKIKLNSIQNFKGYTQESTCGEKKEITLQQLSLNGPKQLQKSNERKYQKSVSRLMFNGQSNVYNNKKLVMKISQFGSMSNAYQSTKINLAKMKKIFR